MTVVLYFSGHLPLEFRIRSNRIFIPGVDNITNVKFNEYLKIGFLYRYLLHYDL